MTTDIRPKRFSKKQASIRGNCSETTVLRAIAAGEVVAYRMGRRLSIDADSFDAWLDSQPFAELAARAREVEQRRSKKQ